MLPFEEMPPFPPQEPQVWLLLLADEVEETLTGVLEPSQADQEEDGVLVTLAGVLELSQTDQEEDGVLVTLAGVEEVALSHSAQEVVFSAVAMTGVGYQTAGP